MNRPQGAVSWWQPTSDHDSAVSLTCHARAREHPSVTVLEAKPHAPQSSDVTTVPDPAATGDQWAARIFHEPSSLTQTCMALVM